jgi:hypothetical protein
MEWGAARTKDHRRQLRRNALCKNPVGRKLLTGYTDDNNKDVSML